MILMRAGALALAFVANAALADAPRVSLRPMARPASLGLPEFSGPRPPARPAWVVALAGVDDVLVSTNTTAEEIARVAEAGAVLSDAGEAPAQNQSDQQSDADPSDGDDALAAPPSDLPNQLPEAPEAPVAALPVEATASEEPQTSADAPAALGVPVRAEAPTQPRNLVPAALLPEPQPSLEPLALPQQSSLEAPAEEAAPRPVPRPPLPRPTVSPPSRVTLHALLDEAQLGGAHSVAMVELETGGLLVDMNASVELPPASVTKALTALYALEHLGQEMRFTTRVVATGPIQDGIVQGDLALLGGGDPTLDSDDLAGIVSDLKAAGIRGVSGRFLVWGSAMPYIAEISPAQMDHLAYNPALSGLNLNYNRVHFEWRRRNGRYVFQTEARSEAHTTPVSVLRVSAADRAVPIYDSEAVDSWTVARQALGEAGSRWMPVRRPASYTGEVMQALAAEQGVSLPAPFGVQSEPQGVEIVSHESEPLREILREMLFYSTNLTAEIVGLAASNARTEGVQTLADSADKMQKWLETEFEVSARFFDHSGLDERNRISAAAMVRLLASPKARAQLRPVLKNIQIDGVPEYPGMVAAKTGTLNFVSTLAGYVEGADGTPMAFAIFTGDLPRRAQNAAVELPEGAAGWNARAKKLQEQFLRRWRLRIAPPF